MSFAELPMADAAAWAPRSFFTCDYMISDVIVRFANVSEYVDINIVVIVLIIGFAYSG